ERRAAMPENDMERELAKTIADSVMSKTQTGPQLRAVMPKADDDIRSSSEHISDAMDTLEQIPKDIELLRAALGKCNDAIRELTTKLDKAHGEVMKARSRL